MTDHPILIYTSLIVGVLLLIVQAVPKFLGPLGTAVSDWSRRRREDRIAKEEADWADVQRQVTYLTREREKDRVRHEQERADLKAELAEHRRIWAAREDRWRKEWQIHRQWDFRAQEALIGHEPPFDISPPFMSPDPLENGDP